MDWGGVQRLQLQMCKEEKHNSAVFKKLVSVVMMMVVGVCVCLFNVSEPGTSCDILKSLDLYQNYALFSTFM